MAAEASSPQRPHPLQPATEEEVAKARDILLKSLNAEHQLFFRSGDLDEPKKDELLPFLEAELTADGAAPKTYPARRITFVYDLIEAPGKYELKESVVDLDSAQVVKTVKHPSSCQASFTIPEFTVFIDACVASPLFQEALKEFQLPENFTVTMDPWPYGGLDPEDSGARLMQGLIFARDASKNSNDSNHYSYPLPIIPVMDVATKEIIRVDRLATGGKGDGIKPSQKSETPIKIFEGCLPSEYVPELMDIPLRTDMKPINITQPEGASFQVHSDNLVTWQKWRFRVGFTPREGAVLHDIRYDGRPVLYRLSFSEMTVPYGDPRPPFHRKQAFDFGDGGCGRAANNLQLGCDCLGAIHYFDALLTDPEGRATKAENVICLHEQDNGIGWKHTNFRTNNSVSTRLRELVVQFVVTLANYEYIFMYKLDTAGGITVETRATGIVSVVAIEKGKTSDYGNVVSPGALAQNHQHIFAVRIDPGIDSFVPGETAVLLEESHPVPMNPETNPYGNAYEIRRQLIDKAMYADAEPKLNRVVRMEHVSKKNPVSGKNVGYKFTPAATQLLLADPNSTQAKRAPFAQHHLWVTGHRDGELWAAGEFTNQSRQENGGVKAMVERGDWFAESAAHTNGTNGEAVADSDHDDSNKGQMSSPVVWSVFGLTHNPRTEDWPVMPVEIHQIHIKPSDFFTVNPSLDVPSSKNEASVLVSCCDKKATASKNEAPTDLRSVQKDPVAHMQGAGPDIDPKALGNGTKEKRRLSTTLTNLLGINKK